MFLPLGLIGAAGIQVWMLMPYSTWNLWIEPLIVGLAVVSVAGLSSSTDGFREALPSPRLWEFWRSLLLRPSGPSLPFKMAGAVNGFPRRGRGLVLTVAESEVWVQAINLEVTRRQGALWAAPAKSKRQRPGSATRPAWNRSQCSAGAERKWPCSERIRTWWWQWRHDICRGPVERPGARPCGLPAGQPGGQSVLVATTTSSYASIFMLATDQPAMALGGYQGWDRVLTPNELAQLVAQGDVRFFYIPTQVGFGRGGGSLDATSDLTAWVRSNCSTVSSDAWTGSTGSPDPSTAAGPRIQRQGRGVGREALQLYQCESPA